MCISDVTLTIVTKHATYTAINPNEHDNQFIRLYIVCPTGIGDNYLVFADCESDALDELADYAKEKGYNGYFLDEDNCDIDDYGDDIVYAGNGGWPMVASGLYFAPASKVLRNMIANGVAVAHADA